MTRSVVLLLMAGFSNFAMNVIAFTLIASITPVSYAVANATKRIVIIASSLFFLQNPVTTSNLCGMMVAVLGVLMYNKVSCWSIILKLIVYIYSPFTCSHTFVLAFLWCNSYVYLVLICLQSQSFALYCSVVCLTRIGIPYYLRVVHWLDSFILLADKVWPDYGEKKRVYSAKCPERLESIQT